MANSAEWMDACGMTLIPIEDLVDNPRPIEGEVSTEIYIIEGEIIHVAITAPPPDN